MSKILWLKKVFFHRSFWCKVVCKLWMHPIFFPFQKIKKFLWTYVHMFSVCAFTSWLPPFTCKNIRIKIQKLFRSKVVILYIIVHGHVYMRTHNRLLYLKSRWSKTKTKFGKSKINANEFQNVQYLVYYSTGSPHITLFLFSMKSSVKWNLYKVKHEFH